MRLGFAGTPEFARVALAQLLDHGAEVVLVLTQPDRPAGRGMKLQSSPVKLTAQAHHIPVWQPASLRLDGKFADQALAAQAALREAALDVLIVAAYGLILPSWVLNLPRLGCINIHASLLPRWRGAAPIHRAIEAGDALTGITIMQMDEGLDTGAMLLSQSLAIDAHDTTASLHDRLAELGGQLMLQTLALAQSNRLQAQAQASVGVTYAKKIEKSEAHIDWRRSATEIERRIRAFDPFPGAFFMRDGAAIKVWRAQVEPSLGQPGRVLAIDAQRCVVACGEGCLALQVVQRPGGNRISISEFLRTQPLCVGEQLD